VIALIVLALVFLLIAFRQWFDTRLEFWQILLGGAVVVLVTGQIQPTSALKAINPDVMVFLFGMFLVGQALEESGYLAHLSHHLFQHTKTTDQLVLSILFGAGLMSALLMNDTLAIIGTPVVLLLARKHRIAAQPLILALAFAITTGSVFSPIGNPQNLLIALTGGLGNPFPPFLSRLFAPTVINLFLTYAVLKLFFKSDFHPFPLVHLPDTLRDPALAKLARFSLWLVLALALVKVLAVFTGVGAEFRLTYLAVAGALPILLLSPRRWELLLRLDWHTLVFFAALFVLMEAVWQTGWAQSQIASIGRDLTTLPMILAVSVLLSQLISNVPLVALYLPVLQHAGTTPAGLVALAAGSTIAGNLFIFGAASNIIIVHNAERKTGHTLTFLEFAKVGAPLTTLQVLVYYLFLR
jgi:Na+/H+ antiporter NhaD/arsenite permease-like protein